MIMRHLDKMSMLRPFFKKYGLWLGIIATVGVYISIGLLVLTYRHSKIKVKPINLTSAEIKKQLNENVDIGSKKPSVLDDKTLSTQEQKDVKLKEQGFDKAPEGSPCFGTYQIQTDNGPVCSHGPDSKQAKEQLQPSSGFYKE